VTLRTLTGDEEEGRCESFYHPASHGVSCLWAGARGGPGARREFGLAGGRWPPIFVHTSQALTALIGLRSARSRACPPLERAFDVCGMGADGDRTVLCDPRAPLGEAADRVLRLPLSDDAGVRGQPEHGPAPTTSLHQSAGARAVTFPPSDSERGAIRPRNPAGWRVLLSPSLIAGLQARLPHRSWFERATARRTRGLLQPNHASAPRRMKTPGARRGRGRARLPG